MIKSNVGESPTHHQTRKKMFSNIDDNISSQNTVCFPYVISAAVAFVAFAAFAILFFFCCSFFFFGYFSRPNHLLIIIMMMII